MNKAVNQYLFNRKSIWIVSILCALLLTASYDPLNWRFLAFFAIAPVYFILLRRKDRGVFGHGLIFAFVHFFTSFYWLSTIEPLRQLNAFGMSIAWFAHIALWFYLVRKLHWNLVFRDSFEATAEASPERFILSWQKKLILVVAASALWCFQEWFRTWLWTGFPWNLLGNSQVYQPGLRDVASSFGVLGVSFVVISVNMTVALLFEELYWRRQLDPSKSLSKKGLFLTSIALCPALIIIAFTQVMKVENIADKKLNIALIQGRYIPSLTRALTERERVDILKSYIQMTQNSFKKGETDLVIWPETCVPYAYRNNQQYYDVIQSLISKDYAPMLIGSSYYSPKGERYNSAFLIEKDSKEQRYDKIHTVPYGEYTPFKDILSTDAHAKLNQMIGMGPSLDSGKSYKLLEFNSAKFGINICFEDVFPQNSIIYANKGAHFLVTLTNDAWFLESVGGQQHTAHSIFRSIETGLPSIRSGNNSESCLILPNGELQDLIVDPKTGSRFYEGSKNVSLPYCSKPKSTFYQRFPNAFLLFIEVISVLSIFFLFLQYFQKKSKFAHAIEKRLEK